MIPSSHKQHVNYFLLAFAVRKIPVSTDLLLRAFVLLAPRSGGNNEACDSFLSQYHITKILEGRRSKHTDLGNEKSKLLDNVLQVTASQ